MTSKQIGFTRPTVSTEGGLTVEEIIEIIEAAGCKCSDEIKEAMDAAHNINVVDAFDVPLFNAATAV